MRGKRQKKNTLLLMGFLDWGYPNKIAAHETKCVDIAWLAQLQMEGDWNNDDDDDGETMMITIIFCSYHVSLVLLYVSLDYHHHIVSLLIRTRY